MKQVKHLLLTLFYLIFLGSLLLCKQPNLPETNLKSLNELLTGREEGYDELGSQYALFKHQLPHRGAISFMMNSPFHPYGKTIEQLYTAQSYLIPLVLNPNAGEAICIIYCSNADIAKYRMAGTGYRMLMTFTPGKGIAVKKP